jgi:hypothetical protein
MEGYQQGTIRVSEHIEFLMHNTARQITHYIPSKYFKSAQGRLRNICNAIVDLEWAQRISRSEAGPTGHGPQAEERSRRVSKHGPAHASILRDARKGALLRI